MDLWTWGLLADLLIVLGGWWRKTEREKASAGVKDLPIDGFCFPVGC